MNTPLHQTKQPPVVRGEYSRNGYEIWRDGWLVYWAGNHVQDSGQPALRREDHLPLVTLRRFCIKTAREIAIEQGGRFVGVERVMEESPDAGQ